MNHYYIQISEIEKEINSEHQNFLSQYKQRGQNDGRVNQPPSDFNGISPIESAIQAGYQGLFHNFMAQGGQILQKQESDVEHIGSDLNLLVSNPSIISSQIADLEEQKRSAIQTEQDRHQNIIGSLYQTPSYLTANNNFQDIDSKYQSKAKAVGRAKPHMKGNWYLVILFLLGISEFMLNYNAFATSGGSPLETAIMALSAGIIFPVIAHFVSLVLRQKDEMPKNSLWFASLIFLLAIVLAFYLSWKRVQEAVANLIITDDKIANTTLIMFALLVMSIFIAGGLFAFFAHDPSPEFMSLHKSREVAKRELDKEANKIHADNKKEDIRHLTEIEQIKLKYDQEIKGQKSRINELKDKFRNAVAEHRSSCDYFKNISLNINSNYHLTIQTYRGANLQNRNSNNGTPKSWEKSPNDLKMDFEKYTNKAWVI